MPAKPRRLDIAEDMAFQERSWVWQRLLWASMVLLLLAALLGLFSRGPLSSTERVSGDGLLSVEFERFERWMTGSKLALRLSPRAVENGLLAVEIEQRFLESLRVRRIEPPPQSSELAAGKVRLLFRAGGGDLEHRVVIYTEPGEIGVRRGMLGLARREPLALWQFVFP